MTKPKLSNLYIKNTGQTIDYSYPNNVRSKDPNYPPRPNRQSHADKLNTEFLNAWAKADKYKEDIRAISVPMRYGVYLQIKGQTGYDLITKSLENINKNIRLCNIKTDKNEKVLSCTVYVPENEKEFFIKKINK